MMIKRKDIKNNYLNYFYSNEEKLITFALRK